MSVNEEKKTGTGEELSEVAEHLPKLFKALSDSLPDMISKIMKAVYSSEVGEEYGKSVGAFYKALKDNGIPEREAMDLAREFIVNQQQFIGSALKQGRFDRVGSKRDEGASRE